MTISTSYAPDSYAGNGSLDTFAITFEFLSDGDNIKVSIKDSSNVVTEKTAATHYNVSGSNVVFTAGNIPASTDTVIIELNPDFLQQSDYTENSALPAETLETDLDERCLESQINQDLIGRSFKVTSDTNLSGKTLGLTLPSSGTEVVTVSSTGIDSNTAAALGVVTLPVSVSEGGTGSTTASAARTALGLAIGTDVQGYDTDLTTLSTAFTTASTSGPASLALAEDTDNGSNTVTITAPAAVTSDRTLTLLDADTTIVGTDTTQTITNKTIDANSNTITDLPYDIAFNAGYTNTMTGSDLVVQTYCELVMARSGEIVGEAGYLGTVATGAAVILDIEKNGTTIYSTKPQFAVSTNTLTAGVLKTDGTEDFVSGDRITFKITQIGSTIAGQELRFTLKTEV